MNIGDQVAGVSVDGTDIEGKIERIVGFGNVAIVRINEDRLGLTEAHIKDLRDIK
jgi:hypothetical protein